MSQNQDIFDKNTFQYLKNIVSSDYLHYINYLYGNIILINCPNCSKKTLKRSHLFDQNNEKWIIECNKCKWKVEIKKPNIIQLKKYEYQLMKKNEEIMNKLIMIVHKNNLNFTNKINQNVKKQYTIYQSNFKKNREILNKIHSIYDTQHNSISANQNEVLTIIQEMMKLSVKKKNIYNKIDKSISLPLKLHLYQIYSNEKKINNDRLKELEKELKLSISNIENWISYFSISQDYLILYKKYNQNIHLIKNKLNDFNLLNNIFVSEKEHIQVITPPVQSIPSINNSSPIKNSTNITIKPKKEKVVKKKIIGGANTNNNLIKSIQYSVSSNTNNINVKEQTPTVPTIMKIVKKNNKLINHPVSIIQNKKEINQQLENQENTNKNNLSLDFLELLNNNSSQKFIQKQEKKIIQEKQQLQQPLQQLQQLQQQQQQQPLQQLQQLQQPLQQLQQQQQQPQQQQPQQQQQQQQQQIVIKKNNENNNQINNIAVNSKKEENYREVVFS
jgi:hypothetical protein